MPLAFSLAVSTKRIVKILRSASLRNESGLGDTFKKGVMDEEGNGELAIN